MGTATNVNPKSAAFAPLAGPDHRVINRDQTEGVTINRYGTPDGRPIGRYQLRILAWVAGHAGCSAIEAVGRDRNPYGSSYTRPVQALAPKPTNIVEEAQRAQDGMRHAMLDGDQAEAQRLRDEREALIDCMGPLLRQQIAVNRQNNPASGGEARRG
jgi:hypothetical protein